MYNDVMIDIETLGTHSYAAIMSVAAVRFCRKTGNVSHQFTAAVDVNTCLQVGLLMEWDTILWWIKQSKEAQEAYLLSEKFSLSSVLISLNGFIKDGDNVWGNGARFDLGLLLNAYERCNIPVSWKYKNEMCVRTIANLIPEVKANHKWTGIAHEPLSDCINQVQYLVESLKKLNT